MRDSLTTLVELVGMGMVTTGCWLVAPSLGLVVGGLLLILIGWLASTRPRAQPAPE